MHSEMPRWRALANAGFAIAALALAAFGVTRVANRHWHLRETFRARAEFAQVGGLDSGAPVRVQGIDAGVVERIEPPSAPGEPVGLVLKLDGKLRGLIRGDAMARIATQGVVGAKVVEITPGRPEAPELEEGGTLRSEAPVELADILKGADESLKNLNAVAAAARDGLGEINAIAGAIREGRGSLGRLVQEDDAYERLVALSDRGERTLNDLDDNLLALKGTWPLSRYFDRRGFSDRERVLFHPEAECDRRVLAEADLFEPGRAVLTSGGKQRLDALAPWLKTVLRSPTEIVIAGFHDDPRGDDLAELLSQQQADAVRNYLVTRHTVQSKGWWGSRKVASVGFGKQVPRTAPSDGNPRSPRRVEVLLFTPQG
ncbi:MAG: OmpA family protein [Isosphaeraceae bacterium]